MSPARITTLLWGSSPWVESARTPGDRLPRSSWFRSGQAGQFRSTYDEEGAAMADEEREEQQDVESEGEEPKGEQGGAGSVVGTAAKGAAAGAALGAAAGAAQHYISSRGDGQEGDESEGADEDSGGERG
jgi:hypothetical protein